VTSSKKARVFPPRASAGESLYKHSPNIQTHHNMEFEYTTDGKGARSLKFKLSLATIIGWFS
jgi:hypothetical protein